MSIVWDDYRLKLSLPETIARRMDVSSHDPMARFNAWFAQARAHAAIEDATAMSLATANADGAPSVRMVLLKEVSDAGFLFYTNMHSRKSEELQANPQVALCFYWVPLGKQVRIEGQVRAVSAAQADAYFASRPRARQIGAWASLQSQPMRQREDLDRRVAEIEKRFEGQPVPRPPHWSGWQVTPHCIEFWQASEARLHVRELFTRQTDGEWGISYLYP